MISRQITFFFSNQRPWLPMHRANGMLELQACTLLQFLIS